MRGAVLSLRSSGGALNGTFTVYTEEEEEEDMSTSPSPTEPSSHLTPDDIAVVVGFFAFLLFLLFLVMLLFCIYRKDPRKCCKICSCQRPCGDMDAPPQYHSSRQTLVGSACLDQTHIINDNPGQAGQLFFVGLPSSYSLPGPPPRLPSYESVRKKDRQRQIHMMIADRFGLNGPIVSEPPPTYEETIRQSVELPYNVLSSGPDLTSPPGFYANPGLDAPQEVSSEANSGAPPV